MSTSEIVKNVSVVIVTYNGAPWIRECLLSIEKNDYKSNIVVVDNNSSDDTVSIIQEKFPEVVVIREAKNLGFGQANNVGISYALKNGAAYIFLLNQDTTIQPDVISLLVRSFLLTDNEFGIISPLHMDDTGKNLDTGFLQFIKKDFKPSMLSNITHNTNEEVLPVSFVNAAAWMINADVFEPLGGFAPLFFHYGEDRDFVNRLYFYGQKIGLLPGAKIQHYRNFRDMNISKWTYNKIVNYYYVGWLSRAANINVSFISGWYDGFIWCLKETLVSVVEGKMSALIIFLHVFIKIIDGFGKIKQHRRMVRDKMPYKFLVSIT